VAILDGGIYDLHPDLAPNVDTACSVSFVPGQPYNTDTGSFWHGTHIAGIVAAADNGFGVIGVAPEATILGVKVLHDNGGTVGQVIGGILYASDPAAFFLGACPRADIINMSLGTGFLKSDPNARGLVALMNRAVNYAARQGVLVVSAAGNEAVDIRDIPGAGVVPANSGTALAVSATGPVDVAHGGMDYRRPASYSDFGQGFISVAGPGGDSTLFPNGLWFLDMVLSTCRGVTTPPDFSFCFAAGTSMATAAVSGVAALIVGDHPKISLGALKAKLQQTADDEGKGGHDAFYGHGFVNALRAVVE
jgi:subtilisin family serine protease